MLDAPALAEATVIGGGDVRAVQYGTDAGLYVEFYNENVYMEFLSEQEGRPIYEKQPYIRIYTPGDKTKVVVRKAVTESTGGFPSDVQRFPQQWAAFQQGVQAVATGLPLEEWPIMTTGQVKALNSVNIYTVEQLAAVPDSALDSLGHGGRSIRDQAVAKLNGMKDESHNAKILAQNAEMQRQIEELRAMIGAQESPDAPRRGRPPKERIEEDGEQAR